VGSIKTLRNGRAKIPQEVSAVTWTVSAWLRSVMQARVEGEASVDWGWEFVPKVPGTTEIEKGGKNQPQKCPE
jgi:hypothetical protein